MNYKAFISYSHQDNTIVNRKWATWLQEQLESFDVPELLVGQASTVHQKVPKSLYPIFRDETELTPNWDLNGALRKALDDSEYLIVICSSNSKNSAYVISEIEYFKTTRDPDRVIAVLIEGGTDPLQSNCCFPEPLIYFDGKKYDYDNPIIPLACDFRRNREGQEGKTDYRSFNDENYSNSCQNAILQISATLLGVPLADLTERHVKSKAESKLKSEISKLSTKSAQDLIDQINTIIRNPECNLKVEEKTKIEKIVYQFKSDHITLAKSRTEVLRFAYNVFTSAMNLIEVGDIDEALVLINDALELVSSIELDTESEHLKAGLLIAKGEIFQRFKRPESALKIYTEALKCYDRSKVADTDPAYITSRVKLCDGLREVNCVLNNTSESLLNLKLMHKWTKKLKRHCCEKSQYQRSIATYYTRLGNHYRKTGDRRKQLKYLKKSLRITERMHKGKSVSFQDLKPLAIAYDDVGDSYLELRFANTARTYYERGNKIFRHLCNCDSSDLDFQFDLAVNLKCQFVMFRYLEDLSNQERLINEAVSIMKNVTYRSMDNRFLHFYNEILLMIIDLHKRQNMYFEASQFAKERIEVLEQILTETTEDIQLLREYANAHSDLAFIYNSADKGLIEPQLRAYEHYDTTLYSAEICYKKTNNKIDKEAISKAKSKLIKVERELLQLGVDRRDFPNRATPVSLLLLSNLSPRLTKLMSENDQLTSWVIDKDLEIE